MELQQYETTMRLQSELMEKIAREKSLKAALKVKKAERLAQFSRAKANPRSVIERSSKAVPSRPEVNKYPDFLKYAMTEHPEWFDTDNAESFHALKPEFRNEFEETMKYFDIEQKHHGTLNEKEKSRRYLFKKNLLSHKEDDGTEFCTGCYRRHKRDPTKDNKTYEVRKVKKSKKKKSKNGENEAQDLESVNLALNKLIFGPDYKRPTDQHDHTSVHGAVENVEEDVQSPDNVELDEDGVAYCQCSHETKVESSSGKPAKGKSKKPEEESQEEDEDFLNEPCCSHD